MTGKDVVAGDLARTHPRQRSSSAVSRESRSNTASMRGGVGAVAAVGAVGVIRGPYESAIARHGGIRAGEHRAIGDADAAQHAVTHSALPARPHATIPSRREGAEPPVKRMPRMRQDVDFRRRRVGIGLTQVCTVVADRLACPVHLRARSPMSYAVVNPATGETIKTFPTISGEELEAAIAAADLAHRTWSKSTTVEERAALIRRVGELHVERRAGARRDHRARDGQAHRAGARRGRLRRRRSTSTTPTTPPTS